MSSFDLVDWCKHLNIPIRNVLSREQKLSHNYQLAILMYSLEPAYMSGSHWVATYVRDNVISYFDSFGMPPFQQIVAKKKNLTLLHKSTNSKPLYDNLRLLLSLFFK